MVAQKEHVRVMECGVVLSLIVKYILGLPVHMVGVYIIIVRLLQMIIIIIIKNRALQ